MVEKKFREVAELMDDEEYLLFLQAALVYCIIKYCNGILSLSVQEWESVVGTKVGGKLNITSDATNMVVTISDGEDAKA